MAENRSLSSSEEYIKKSNRKLLFAGLGILVLFLTALMLFPSAKKNVEQEQPINFVAGEFEQFTDSKVELSPLDRSTGGLVPQPEQVTMNNVVLGSKAEALIVLTAEKAPVLFMGMELAETQQDGFTLETTCPINGRIETNGTCHIKVFWNPVELRQIQNLLSVRWRLDDGATYNEQTTRIQISAQSTDSKDCVICENVANEAAKKPRQAMMLDGTLADINKDGTFELDGKKYRVTENDIIIDEDGNIVGVAEPKRIPLDLTHKILGTISDTQDVINANGEKIGRLLGDGTIVTQDLKVIGAAVPVVSVMDDFGNVIGKMLMDGTVVDGQNTVIGRPLVDGSVADLSGSIIGVLRPWGLVNNFIGDVIGAVLPDGNVFGNTGQNIARISPTGLAIDATGELIGGVVPQGVGVGAGCKALGTVLQNGDVKDAFEQIVGKALIDGSIVDKDLNEIGSVISQGLVINEKGDILGFINSEGKAIDKKGAVIGCANPDGSVSAGKKPLGAVMAKGRVIGQGCVVLGSVYPNGIVMSVDNTAQGRVLADKYVSNNANRIIGVVIPRGTAIAEGCRLLGLISLNGRVLETTGTDIGCMTTDGNIVNDKNEVIGTVNKRGVAVDFDGNVIGRARIDGKVIDKTGKVIGCVNPDGSIVDLDGKLRGQLIPTGEDSTGVILDADGNPTGQTVISNKVYNANGDETGTLTENGWVVNEDGHIIGVMPPDGIIFSPEGLILGRYSQKTGVAVNMAGERFAKILPDFTAISGDKNDIIGALIADKTNFVTSAGAVIGTMQIDGTLTDATNAVVGAIRADGSVINKEGAIIATKVLRGNVLSTTGDLIGTVTPQGEVISAAKTVIGRVLGNGLAIANNGSVLGGVMSDIILAIDSDGLLGSVSIQGTVSDKNGRILGKVSPFGLVLGANGELLGKTLRVGPVVDSAGHTVGWLSFDGSLTGKDGASKGYTLSNGIILNQSGAIIGSVVPRGIVVGANGQFVGAVAPNARVFQQKEIVGSLKASPYFYNVDQKIAGQHLKPGIALDTNGAFLGWTRYDGVVENNNKTVGTISLDGHIYDKNGQIVGFYLPLGTPAFNDSGKSFGFVGANGFIVNTKGDILGKAISRNSVVQDGQLVAKLFGNSDFVTDLSTGSAIGQVSPNGMITGLSDAKPLGTATMNGFGLNLTKQVIGGIVRIGAPISHSLQVLGTAFSDGSVNADGKSIGKTTATQSITPNGQTLSGFMEEPTAFIGRNGNVIGSTTGDVSVVTFAGAPIAKQTPFGTALTQETIWAGAQMPSGVVVTDDGFNIGTVATDGAVLNATEVVARILPDGSAAGIVDRASYTTMPYVGSVVKQGLPVHFKGTILGRTTLNGLVVDATDKRVSQILDDGTLMGSTDALDGTIVPFGFATTYDGDILGSLNGEGTVVTAGGTVKGIIASNGAVKGNHALKIEGAMVVGGLITNGCNVLGQTTQDGQIINGQGHVVGRTLIDKTAVNKSGETIGQITTIGGVLSTTGDFIGRSLPDASVVDERGTQIGCVGKNAEVMDSAGTVMGCVLKRGPIISKDGTLLGRSKFNGTIVNASNAVIGKMGGDCQTALDNDGKAIGRMVSQDEELMYNPDGSISGTFSRNGEYFDPEGNHIFTVKPNGDIIDPKTGEVISHLDEDGVIRSVNGDALSDMTVLVDKNGHIMGIVSGCDVLNTAGTKIASIMSDGSVIDLNGELYATILGNGTILDKEGTEIGSVAGTNTQLDKCGIHSTKGGAGGAGAVGRRIFIGNQAFGITNNGSLVTSDGTVIGYMGEDGRPFGLNGKLLTGADSSGRTTPNLNQKLQATPEQTEQMQQLLAKRRQSMRENVKNVIKPDGRLLARSKKKQDVDWGLPRIVSSWPVKMTNMILKDKAIPAVLVRSLDSRYPSVPATAIVERHIYSEEGRNIIIPAGSRLIGQMAGNGGENHVAKLEISWQRLIRPDGGAFSFNATSGDAQGRGGVAAYLDEQLLAKYGKPILSSTVTSAIAYLTASNDDVSTTEGGTTTQSDRSKAAEDARNTFTDNMDQIFQQLIDESTSIPPVVFVPAGTRMTIFSNEDLWLRSEDDDVRDYDESFGPDSQTAHTAPTSSWIEKRGTPTQQIEAGATQGNAAQDVYYDPSMTSQETIDQATYDNTPIYNGNDVIDQQYYNDVPQNNEPQNSESDLTNRVSKPVLPKMEVNTNKMF